MITATYAIPDLHGRLDLLEAALNKINKRRGPSRIVFLGDYIDRGPQSRQVVERLIHGPDRNDQEWTCLGGNHEEMMVMATKYGGLATLWFENGGLETMRSYGIRTPGQLPDFRTAVPEDHTAWMEGLPTTFCDQHRVFVHAWVDPSKPGEETHGEDAKWKRYHPMDQGGDSLGRFVVHGHTPHPEIILKDRRVNLDTGAAWTGKLVVAVFDNRVPGPPTEYLTVTDRQ